MVTLNIKGGFGNQLFQYATGRAHSLRTNSSLYVDTTHLNQNQGPDVTNRSFRLDAFDLPFEYVRNASIHWLDWVFFKRISRIVANVNQNLAIRLFKLYTEDRSLKFDPNLLELPGDIKLDGYWQTERYFDEFAETLRSEISVQNPISGENKQWYDHISDTESTSIHVRRGDYVSLGWALPQAYYRNALEVISQETNTTDLFFFSDDIDWVRAHRGELLPPQSDFEVHFVACNDGETAHEDIRLMRSCDHHVIANSSFSWWGAWLNGSETKLIAAPDFWVHDSVNNLDIVPSRWTTVGWKR